MVIAEWGIFATMTDIKAAAKPQGLLPFINRLARFVPAEWLAPTLAPMFPEVAKEIAFMCSPQAQPRG